MTVFKPMLDKHIRRSPLVPTLPHKLERSFMPRSFPIMLGSSKDEGLSSAIAIYLRDQAHFSSPESLKSHLLPKLMVSLFGEYKGSRQELIEAAFRQYFAEVKTGAIEETVSALGEMLGDVLVNSCLRETILLHREHGSPIYSYVFSHAGLYFIFLLLFHLKNLSGHESQPNINLGRMSGLFTRQTPGEIGYQDSHVWRGDDLLYVWQMEGQTDHNTRIEDKLISQNMTSMLATFAKTG